MSRRVDGFLGTLSYDYENHNQKKALEKCVCPRVRIKIPGKPQKSQR